VLNQIQTMYVMLIYSYIVCTDNTLYRTNLLPMRLSNATVSWEAPIQFPNDIQILAQAPRSKYDICHATGVCVCFSMLLALFDIICYFSCQLPGTGPTSPPPPNYYTTLPANSGLFGLCSQGMIYFSKLFWVLFL
jgi:hypothetical protein